MASGGRRSHPSHGCRPFTPRANLPKRARRSLEPVKTVGDFIESALNRELAAQRFNLTPHLGDFRPRARHALSGAAFLSGITESFRAPRWSRRPKY
jgi:hypothetical protein